MANTNISGDFASESREFAAVRAYLKKLGVNDANGDILLKKCDDADAGDIKVILPNRFVSLFEVKQESYARFSKYGEYGFDLVSVLRINDGAASWKGLHQPNEFGMFCNNIAYDSNLKWGKLVYSYSDIWLFFVEDEDGNFVHLEGYDTRKMRDSGILGEICTHCPFAVNRKPASQNSYSDSWDSATFFVKPKMLEPYRATKYDLIHNKEMWHLVKPRNYQPYSQIKQ